MTGALGMVFGVFDGLHEGHRDFLQQARAKCGKLIVVLTLPEAVRELKGREPKRSYEERANALKAFDPTLTVVQSDARLHSWEVLSAHKPDMVFLGYDQQAIATELEKMGVPFESLDAHRPETFKSSLLDR